MDIRFEKYLPPIYSLFHAGTDGQIAIEVLSQRYAHRVRGAVVGDTIDRLPQTCDKGIYLKQQLKNKLTAHRQYINTHGQDMPEIRDWKWHTKK